MLTHWNLVSVWVNVAEPTQDFEKMPLHALVIVDTIFNEILKVDIKMVMSMELGI